MIDDETDKIATKIADELHEYYEDRDNFVQFEILFYADDDHEGIADIINEAKRIMNRNDRHKKLQKIVDVSSDLSVLLLLIEFIRDYYGEKPKGPLAIVLKNAKKKAHKLREDKEVKKNKDD